MAFFVNEKEEHSSGWNFQTDRVRHIHSTFTQYSMFSPLHDSWSEIPFFSCEFGPKYHTLIKIFVHPVGRPTIFFDAAGGAQVPYWWFGQYLFIMRCFFSENIHHEMCIVLVRYAENRMHIDSETTSALPLRQGEDWRTQLAQRAMWSSSR